MLLELAIGDAYGAGFEYAPEDFVRARNDLSAYVQHPRHTLLPGCYTDDTQMTIAVVEAMLADADWTAELLAGAFVAAYQRDPRAGYSRRTRPVLESSRNAADYLACVNADSNASGAAMRAAPLGLLPTVEMVVARCKLKAALSHNTPGGIGAAVAAALMTHYCHHRLGPKQELPGFLAAHVEADWHTPWRGKVGHEGMWSVRAALTALLACWRMSDLLRACIAFTGDVDTVAVIALAAGSVCTDVEQDLPTHLIAGLERGPFGHDFLVALDRRLMAWAVASRGG